MLRKRVVHTHTHIGLAIGYAVAAAAHHRVSARTNVCIYHLVQHVHASEVARPKKHTRTARDKQTTPAHCTHVSVSVARECNQIASQRSERNRSTRPAGRINRACLAAVLIGVNSAILRVENVK